MHKQNIPAQIAQLESKLQKLKARQLERLHEKLKAARKVVSDLEAEIAAVARKASPSGKRKRTPPLEMRERIFDTLANNPKGLSQMEISDKTSLPYGSVVAFLQRNEKEFKTTGALKRKRYFLK